MPTFQTLALVRTLHRKLALAALLWLALLSCLSWPTTVSAQAVNFEPPVYLHPDLNGNTVMASNAAGQIIWHERLEPYGRKSVLSNSAVGGSSADQGFHGKTRDEETGLIYFGARHYHPLLGRFLSMDPVETQSDNLHSFNRYAFANNNPYKYTDPDGQLPIPIILYYGVTTLTPIVSGLAVRFAASRAVQFGLSMAAGEVGLAVPGAVVVGAKGASEAANALRGAQLKEYYRQLEKYGEAGARELQNGRFRFYGELTAARTPGEMAGARLVREWDSATGATRTWYETLDHAGRVRSVAPKPATETLNHHIFDEAGNNMGRR